MISSNFLETRKAIVPASRPISMGLPGLDDAGEDGARFLLLARQRSSSSSRNRLPLLGNLLRPRPDDAGEVGARFLLARQRSPSSSRNHLPMHCLGISFDLMIPSPKIDLVRPRPCVRPTGNSNGAGNDVLFLYYYLFHNLGGKSRVECKSK